MGILYIVSTPIGNMDDLSLRGAKTLFSVDFIACEDTRKTGLLLEYIKNNILKNNNTHPKLISFYNEVETLKLSEILGILLNDKNVALVSDAGTPLISDPGFKLVRECLKNEIKVVSIPGPTSIIAALSISGLPTDKFSFYGFLPEKKSHAILLLNNIKQNQTLIKTTNIIFVSPYKIMGNLESMLEVFGDIEIVIARELTKIYEEVKKDKISNIINKYKSKRPKGEIVILWN